MLVWLGEIKSYQRAWNKKQIAEITALLLKCNETKPSDIHRSIRTLKHIRHWKGSEFRTILLYVGVVIFKDFLNEYEYQMFLKLVCAVTICSTSVYHKFLPMARKFFNEFIEMHINIYEEHSITSNFHLLSHIVDDVEHLGHLGTISAYQFENTLHHIKLRLKQCNRPLEQIARRLEEISACKNGSPFKVDSNFPKLKHQFDFSTQNAIGQRIQCNAFRYIEYKPNAVLSSANANQKDRWILMKNNCIIQFDFFIEMGERYLIRGASLKDLTNFFETPFHSKYINIHMSDGQRNEPEYYDLSDIKAKLFCLHYKQQFVFIPLLHTM